MTVRPAPLSLLLLALALTPGCVVRRPGAVETPAAVVAAAPAPARVASSPVPDELPAPAARMPAARAPVVVAPAARTTVSRTAGFSGTERPGFRTFLRDGRLWVFASGSEGLAEFLKSGEPAKSVTLIGAGPEGKTLRGSDTETLQSYLAAYRYGRPGYAVFLDDGRLWVFTDQSEDMQAFLRSGEPAKSVTLIGEGPDGKTLRSSDLETARAFLDGR